MWILNLMYCNLYFTDMLSISSFLWVSVDAARAKKLSCSNWKYVLYWQPLFISTFVSNEIYVFTNCHFYNCCLLHWKVNYFIVSRFLICCNLKWHSEFLNEITELYVYQTVFWNTVVYFNDAVYHKKDLSLLVYMMISCG